MSSLIDDDIIIGERIAEKDWIVQQTEYDINPACPLYLITWSPDPGELPDADFDTQHKFFVNVVSEYLSYCSIGLFCVESSQLGRPHYHGWYQLGGNEQMRIVLMKVMQRFGLVKVTKSKGHYKYGSYSDAANCLYYYKKDMIDLMLWVDLNPITKDTRVDIDWNQHFMLFTRQGRQSIADLEEKVVLKDFYKRFYNNSLE